MPLPHPSQFARHRLRHAATLRGIWPQWLAAEGVPDPDPQASITFEHFYLTLQAALDGLGVAMGPTRLIADDVMAGRLVLPFAGVEKTGSITAADAGQGGRRSASF